MNMKKIALILTIILTLTPLVWGQSNVNEMHLKRIHGETVLRIDASGPFQYSHQIENAKDGKPFRIIVDVFPAIHNFGQKIFGKLPVSIVTSLRTSQYATKPEKIVRVVLDLQKSAAYRIEKSGNYIFVYIPDTQTAEFPEWASSVPKTVSTDKPTVAAVESKSETKTVTVESKPPVTVAKTEVKSPVVAVAKADNKSAQTKTPAVSEAKAETKTVSKPVVAEVKSESTPSRTAKSRQNPQVNQDR